MLKIPRIVLAGTTSGVGKTSVACSLIYGLKKLGYAVQPFKVGPDYIDPSYLSSISGRTTRNLDVWLMGNKRLLEEFTSNSKSDVSIIEGVMGYYDGFSGKNNHSSTHHVASITKSNTILVLDAAKTARSIAATALGFAKFHSNSRIAGLVLNRVGSKKHEAVCREALQNLKIPVVGVIPKNSEFSLGSRHLGLIPVREEARLQNKVLKIAKSISEFLDFDQIIKTANDSAPLQKPRRIRPKKPASTIAVALDNSFNFYYAANLESLRREGAKIKFFSSISDKAPPKCDGIYIGGGFPEVLSPSLSTNSAMKRSIKKSADDGIPLYAECGGLMYLTKSIHDGTRRYPMVGLLDADTRMTKKMKLNYTKASIASSCIISNSTKQLRGHEFHYSELSDVGKDLKFAYELEIGHGILGKKDGIVQNNTLASYCHLFLDAKNFAKTFVLSCKNHSRR